MKTWLNFKKSLAAGDRANKIPKRKSKKRSRETPIHPVMRKIPMTSPRPKQLKRRMQRSKPSREILLLSRRSLPRFS